MPPSRLSAGALDRCYRIVVIPEAVGAAHLVSGAAEQLARWWHRNPDISLETVVDGVMTVIWPGLQSRLSDATT